MGEPATASTLPAQAGIPLGSDVVFRPVRKGPWHVLAHTEYGVFWSHCGIRTIGRFTDRPKEAVFVRDLCPNCARAVKGQIGIEPREA